MINLIAAIVTVALATPTIGFMVLTMDKDD